MGLQELLGGIRVPAPGLPLTQPPASKGTCGWSSLKEVATRAATSQNPQVHLPLKHTPSDQHLTRLLSQPQPARAPACLPHHAGTRGPPAHPFLTRPFETKAPPRPAGVLQRLLLSLTALRPVACSRGSGLLTVSSRSITALQPLQPPGPVTRAASAASGSGKALGRKPELLTLDFRPLQPQEASASGGRKLHNPASHSRKHPFLL